MKINFVICTHNNEKIIGKCIESVLNLRKKKGWKIEITVVDDYSTDKTNTIVDSYKVQNTVQTTVRMPEVWGPAFCRNKGIVTVADYYFFMDSDVILDKDCLVELVESKADVCGPKLLLPNGKINSAGGGMTKSGIGYDIDSEEKNIRRYVLPVDVFYICSAAMLVKADVITKIGLFDDTYFYGNEDTDFGWRANLAGYTVQYIPTTEATHLKSQTVSKDMTMVYYNSTKNRFVTMVKNYSLHNLVIYGTIYIGLSMADIVFRDYGLQKLKAWWWVFKNIPSILRKRKAVQRLRKRRDSELPFTGLIKLK